MSNSQLTTGDGRLRHLTLAHGVEDISENVGGPIRVVVAENSYLIREGLASILGRASEVDLAAVCSSGLELQAAIAAENPDVVVTDIRMPPSGTDEGIRVATRLRETSPTTGVVVLTQYAEPSYALDLFDKGAARRAYLLKERTRTLGELIAAIETVARGGSVIDPLILDVLIQARSRKAHSSLSDLTTREREVLAEIATGKSNGAIAESLFLTKRAVEKHVNSIFSKLHLSESQGASPRVKATLIFLSEDQDDAMLWEQPAWRDTTHRSRSYASGQELHTASALA
jgi:DNA-binding NarL/FixJ family response regulator